MTMVAANLRGRLKYSRDEPRHIRQNLEVDNLMTRNSLCYDYGKERFSMLLVLEQLLNGQHYEVYSNQCCQSQHSLLSAYWPLTSCRKNCHHEFWKYPRQKLSHCFRIMWLLIGGPIYPWSDQPVGNVLVELDSSCCGRWMWFRSFLSRLLIVLCLIMSGDVELNPGPYDHHDLEKIIGGVDDTPLKECDWNTLIIECKSLSAEWERISGYLGLSFALIETIKRDNPLNSIGCWNEALKQWVQRNYNTHTFDEPSWRSLLKAIVEVDKLLFQRLAAKHQAADTCVAKKEAAGPSSIEADLRDPNNHIPSVTDPSHPVFSVEQKKRIYERCCSESQHMLYRFQELFSCTRKSLKEEKVSVSELVHHLECLGSIKPTYTDTGLGPLRHQIPRLANAESVDAVMSVVKDYCSFFNYHMMEHIINEFGTPQDKTNLAEYKEDFKSYAENCVVDCSMKVGEMIRKDQAEMYVTLDDSFDNCTLSHLNVFKSDLRKILNISSDIELYLFYINLGSIKLTFQISILIQKAIFPLSSEQEEALSGLGVVQLSCGDYQFTRHVNKDVGDPATDEESDHTEDDAESMRMMGVGITEDSFSIDSAIGSISLSNISTAPSSRSRVTEFSEDTLDNFSVGTGQDVESRSSRMYAMWKGVTPLHLAAEHRDLEDLQKLLEMQKMSLFYRDEKGHTVLHYACGGGKIEIINYLIKELSKYFPDVVHDSDYDGRIPLHYAAVLGHFEAVKFLINDVNCNPNITTNNGTSAIHLAAYSGCVDVVKYLTEVQKCDPSCVTVNMVTPLHIAAGRGNLELVRYLCLEQICDPLCIALNGDTPLHAAAYFGHLEIVQFFIEQLHCPIDIRVDSTSMTPLDQARIQGHHNVVQYLEYFYV